MLERRTFGGDLRTADASTDFDADGLKDRDEFWAGTDPTNDLSLLAITTVDFPASNVVVTFESVATRHYMFSYTTNLLTGPWTAINSNAPLPGLQGQTTFTGTVNQTESQIYIHVSTESPQL